MTQAEQVLVSAALHNFFRQKCRPDEFLPEETSDEQNVTQLSSNGYQFLGEQEQQREHATE